MIGLVVLALGFQFRMVDSFVLNQKTTEIIAKRLNKTDSVATVFVPPAWRRPPGQSAGDQTAAVAGLHDDLGRRCALLAQLGDAQAGLIGRDDYLNPRNSGSMGRLKARQGRSPDQVLFLGVHHRRGEPPVLVPIRTVKLRTST